MRLILTSKGFGNDIVNNKIRNNILIDIKKAKVLFIPTALSGHYSYEKYLPDLIKFGFKEENIIIFDEKNTAKYRNLDIDIIYTCGGNTFTLLKLIRQYHFEDDLKKYLQNGVTYIGRSAGTHLVTKNIKHILEFDKNDAGITCFDALGIFDGIIFCHYSPKREKAYMSALHEKKYNVYRITDEEMILVDGKEIKKI